MDGVTISVHVTWFLDRARCLFGVSSSGDFGRGIVRTKGPKVSSSTPRACHPKGQDAATLTQGACQTSTRPMPPAAQCQRDSESTGRLRSADVHWQHACDERLHAHQAAATYVPSASSSLLHILSICAFGHRHGHLQLRLASGTTQESKSLFQWKWACSTQWQESQSKCRCRPRGFTPVLFTDRLAVLQFYKQF